MITYIDPIKIIIDIFNKQYYEIKCNVQFVKGIYQETKAYGETLWNDEGIFVQIDIETPMVGVVEVLAHELAHVAAGFDNAHNKQWKNVFDDLNKRFNKFMEELN